MTQRHRVMGPVFHDLQVPDIKSVRQRFAVEYVLFVAQIYELELYSPYLNRTRRFSIYTIYP